MTAENQAAATEAQAPVLQPEDLSGPDAGRDLAAGSAPADGPESQPEAAETPQEAAEPAAEAEPQPAPRPAPRVSLRELGERIARPLQHAGAGPAWADLYRAFDAESAKAAQDAGREWSALAREWTGRVQSEMSRDSILAGITAKDAAGTAAA